MINLNKPDDPTSGGLRLTYRWPAELGMNPAKLGKLDNCRHEPWKVPLPQYIERLHVKRFGQQHRLQVSLPIAGRGPSGLRPVQEGRLRGWFGFARDVVEAGQEARLAAVLCVHLIDDPLPLGRLFCLLVAVFGAFEVARATS